MADAEVARVRKAEQVAEIGRYKNSAVVLVCVAQDDPRPLLPTCDSYDSAHGKKDGSGGLNDYLVPNARRVGRRVVRASRSVPREYLAEQLNNAQVSIDSILDETFERQLQLDGVGIGDTRRTVTAVRDLVLAKMNPELGSLMISAGRYSRGPRKPSIRMPQYNIECKITKSIRRSPSCSVGRVGMPEREVVVRRSACVHSPHVPVWGGGKLAQKLMRTWLDIERELGFDPMATANE